MFLNDWNNKFERDFRLKRRIYCNFFKEKNIFITGSGKLRIDLNISLARYCRCFSNRAIQKLENFD